MQREQMVALYATG